MRISLTIYATILGLAILSTTLALSATAQSGRVNEAPRATPTPTPKTTTPKGSAVRAGVESSEEYALVFPTGRDGTVHWKHVEYEQAILSLRSSFIEQLNKAGSQSYRLISITGGYPIGIVKLDEGPYEYAWFQTSSDRFFAKSGFEEKYADFSKHGFRVVENSFMGESCWTDPISKEDICESKDLFLLQREKGIEKPTQHIVISSVPSWRGHPSVEISTHVGEKIAEGFYPSKVLSKFEILLEKSDGNDEVSPDKPDVQVVRSSLGLRDDAILEDKVNDLATQGYRLVLLNNGIAVMYRRSDSATPVSYIWLDTNKKDFEKQLTQLHASGAVYRMTYPNREGNKNKLVFEQSAVHKGERLEYKVLKFEFQEVDDRAANKVHIDLAPSSKETMKLMNSLARQGFVVRDLFASDKVSVLLERSQ